jgi:pyrimidine-nucleoside phosphorylase
MLMAICCRGMDPDETAALTRAMLVSGEQWELAGERPEAVDKHSTGGVGDTVSLVLAPLLAAVGVPVAMMSGRGLAHSQGTLDKLESIPGFGCRWDRRETLDLLDRCGVAMLAQTEAIAPADRVLYALRDVTATVPSLPLIVASIMSKKLALGAGTLVLDVKWGSGAFRSTRAEAVELARALRQVARDAGVAAEALITDMNQPLGRWLGTACEVRSAIDVLSGGGDAPLREVSVALAAEAMVLRGHDRTAARAALTGVIGDGRALAAWQRMVVAHGGDPDPEALPGAERRTEVVAERDGHVVAVDAAALGWVAVDAGAGRRTRDDLVDHAAGLEMAVRVGQRVTAGEPLARLLLGRRPVDVDSLVDRIRSAVMIGSEPVAPPPTILGRLDDLGRETARPSGPDAVLP